MAIGPPLVDRYLDALWMERGLSDHTLSAYRRDLQMFQRWVDERGGDLAAILRPDILEYLSDQMRGGKSNRSTARALSCLRGFYRYLLRERIIGSDPTLDVDGPHLGRPLPKTLSEEDVERLLEAPDVDEPLGLRDRAMLELLYATGLRVSELVSLRLGQVGMSQGIVRVMGKGSKERLVPMGEESLAWLQRYMREARGVLLNTRMSDVLFPSQRGQEMTRQTFWHRIKQHAVTAGIQATVSPHTVRHAFATHLVNHGADLRVVQLLLGHSDLSTTQIYTHVAQQRMQELHARHHPRG